MNAPGTCCSKFRLLETPLLFLGHVKPALADLCCFLLYRGIYYLVFLCSAFRVHSLNCWNWKIETGPKDIMITKRFLGIFILCVTLERLDRFGNFVYKVLGEKNWKIRDKVNNDVWNYKLLWTKPGLKASI